MSIEDYDNKAREFFDLQNSRAEKFCADKKVQIEIGQKHKKQNYTRYSLVEWFCFETKLKRSRNVINTITSQLIDLQDTSPTICQVLEQLEKQDPLSYKEYLENRGISHSKVNEKRYKQIKKEYANVVKMFGDCIDELEQFD